MSIVFVFVDGVGLAPEGPENPLALLPAPALRRLLGGALTLERVGQRPGIVLAALDAGLGVPGLPQSATGQTALFTGRNGAALLGHHATAYPGPRLRAVIAEHSLFKRAREAGLRAAFANPYTPGYLKLVATGERRPSVTTCAVLAAGLELRGLGDLGRDAAVTWDVRRDLFGARLPEPPGEALPVITAEAAGGHLAAVAAANDLTVYETFITDLAAHGRFGLRVEDAVERVDGLLAGLLADLPAGATLVLTSDHGNLEDSTRPTHTSNPVPLLAVGPLAERFAGLRSILEVAPAILTGLGAGLGAATGANLAPVAAGGDPS
jgi:hypothetical protein